MLRLGGQHEETKEAPEDIEQVYFKELDLSGGVEGVDYTIAYGISRSHEEEFDNYTSSLVIRLKRIYNF
jgi:hypothetical protein